MFFDTKFLNNNEIQLILEKTADGDEKKKWVPYLCLDKDRIIGGLGVIENDFHDRKDLTPNVCAVYTEEE